MVSLATKAGVTTTVHTTLWYYALPVFTDVGT